MQQLKFVGSRRLFGALAVTMAVVAACTPTAAPSPTAAGKPGAAASAAPASAGWDQVVEAARKEGKVVIYGQFEQSLQDIYIPKFKEKYPFLEVEVVYGTGPQSAEKVRAEAAAGKLAADMWRSFTDPGLALRDEGLLEKWQAPSIVNERDKFAYQSTDQDEQGYLNNVSAAVQGVMINTTQIKPEDEPKSWFDLADPKYKGKIIFSDPRRPSGGQSMSWFLTQKYGKEGEDFLKKLAQQDLTYEANAAKMAEEVARGEKGIAAPLQWISYSAKKGPNVKFVQPKEGLYYSIANAAIPKGAPHANAAKLWIEWEVSKEGQQVKVDAGSETAIRNDVQAKESWLRLDTAGAWANVTFADRRSKQKEMGERVRAIFGT